MLGSWLLCAMAGYLCGSIPFGYLIGRFNGIDIRRHGSGNIGATNVTRVLGKGWGRACFIGDFLKGFLPVLLTRLWLRHCGAEEQGLEWGTVLAAAGSVCGHMWPCWLNFSGGKGVATSVGALLALAPVPLVASVAVWLVVFAVSRYVSLASICAAAMAPVNALLCNVAGEPWCRTSGPILGLLAAMAILIIVRHRGNIERLRQGTEQRFTKRTHADSRSK